MDVEDNKRSGNKSDNVEIEVILCCKKEKSKMSGLLRGAGGGAGGELGRNQNRKSRTNAPRLNVWLLSRAKFPQRNKQQQVSSVWRPCIVS